MLKLLMYNIAIKFFESPKSNLKGDFIMKKTLILVLTLLLCFSLVACGKNLEAVEESIQGDWERAEESQSSTRILLSFKNGTVIRNEYIGGENTKTTNGVYTINNDGFVVVAYTDGISQTFSAYASADGGTVLMEHDTGVYYNKAD